MTVRLLEPYNGQAAYTLYTGPDEVSLKGLALADDQIEAASDYVKPVSANVLVGSAAAQVGAAARTAEVPAGLGWDQARYPLNIQIINRIGAARRVSSGFDPFQSADYLAARAGTQYYVAVSGSDSNDGLSPGAAKGSILAALTAAKAGGVPWTIKVDASQVYTRTRGSFTISDLGSSPGAIVATNGRVSVSTAEALTWSANATYAWVSQAARAAALRVLDRKNRDRFGINPEYVSVADLAACSRQPGTFYTDNVTVYVNPFPGVVVSDSTVRVLLSVPMWRFLYGSQPGSVFITGDTDADGFDLEGGANASLDLSGNNAASTPKIFAVKNWTPRYGGGALFASGNVYVDSWPGLFYARDCDASGAFSDNWNFHDSRNKNQMYFLLENLSGSDAGRGLTTASVLAPTSNNCLTSHEGVIGIDLGGRYQGAKGKTVHIINNAKLLCVGTTAGGSVGDKMNGGTFDPTEFAADDSAQLWIDDVQASPLADSNLSFLATGTAAIRYRNLGPQRGRMLATGSAVIASY